MTQEEYIDHEVRIRLQEHLIKSLNYKMNALITIAITGILMPLVLNHFGI